MSATTFDAYGFENKPATATNNAADEGSALFPAAPVYERTRKAQGSKLPFMIGVPVALVAAGALMWVSMPRNAAPPAEQPAKVAQVAPTTPVPPSAATSAPMPEPAATAPAQMAQAEPAPAARTAPAPARRSAPAARRAAPPAADTATDVGSASENASATVAAPAPAAPAPVVTAPIAEPAPLSIPSVAAMPAPVTPQPTAPIPQT